MVFDGRSRAVGVRMWKMESYVNHKSATELVFVYNAIDKRKDCRSTLNKQQSFASRNTEPCSVLKGQSSKRKLTLQPRTTYNKCGESSTHEKTYCGVLHRHLSAIPRLSDADLIKILGTKAPLSAVGDSHHVKDRHLEEIKSRGNPAFWAEFKPTELFLTVFKYVEATDIWDITPGSGAAAAAALHAGIKYEGTCANG